ncbi:MAG: hypothetical protein M3179_01615 [Actinomycetota bacterium]|nr:hypothetical protein [Actinomycetota bacterium]
MVRIAGRRLSLSPDASNAHIDHHRRLIGAGGFLDPPTRRPAAYGPG